MKRMNVIAKMLCLYICVLFYVVCFLTSSLTGKHLSRGLKEGRKQAVGVSREKESSRQNVRQG